MARQRDYHAEYVARNERAQAAGFDSDAQRAKARRYVREEWGLDFGARDPRLDAAAFASLDYAAGDSSFDELKELWMEWNDYDEDWEPDEEFYAWLDDLSGEPA